MAKKPYIETPKGIIKIAKNGKAQLSFKLDYKRNFTAIWQGKYFNAQKFVDSEVLRLSEPLTPLRTGMLVKSGILGTDIGSGLVQWIAPYAKAQYYSPRPVGSETGPNRGPYWFKRMKAAHKEKIINGANRIMAKGE